MSFEARDQAEGNARLLQLADHLERGQLGHKRFNFSVVNGDAFGNQLESNGCGTCGCAIGELPIAFPQHFHFNKGFVCMVKEQGWSNEVEFEEFYGSSVAYGAKSVQPFFDLSCEEEQHLFIPQSQDPEVYGGEHLTGAATKEQVAANIRAFVAKRATTPTLESN